MTATVTAAKKSAAAVKALQWVTFKLDKQIYGINVMQIREVLRVIEPTPVPGVPDYMLGIINLRGNVVTVINTRKLFGLSPREPSHTNRTIIIETHNQAIGILVDSIAEVVNLDPAEIETSPNFVDSGNKDGQYIQGIHSRKSDILILIDADKLLPESDLEKLKKEQ